MNKTILLTAVLILTAMVVLWLAGKKVGFQNTPLPNPTSNAPAILSPTPKAFKFNRTTDLKEELDAVMPQVLDSDFEQ